MGAALVAIGADGSTKPTGSVAPENKKGDAAKALLAAIGGAGKDDKDKAADTKGGPSGLSSVSGNVIGVGSNPVVQALQEQQGIAREQLTQLQIIAAKFGYAATYMDVTASGATPSTPANSSTNRSSIVNKTK
jgi:hypothetical protein